MAADPDPLNRYGDTAMARKEAERPTSLDQSSPSRRWVLISAAAIVLLASLVARGLVSNEAGAQQPSNQRAARGVSHRVKPADPNQAGPQHDVMAIVNGKDISRPALAQACVERHGETVLESLVNKRLIEHHCRKRGVTVTPAEIDAELDRMAKRFKLGREQWLELLENQRGVTQEEYKRDILWPTLALRKLAESDLTVSDKELSRAYEARFGPSVRVRLIVVTDAQKAREIQRQAADRPQEFPRLAMEYSEDVNSASIGGLIQPTRPHAGDPAIERVAFDLKPGEISDVLRVGQQHAILKCEGRVPPRNVPLAEVRAELEEGLKEEKLRGVANSLFARLQGSATVVNVYNNPDLRQTMPGVVATVNGDRVSMKELGKECLARHGDEVLQIEIAHLLLQQALKRANLAVSKADLEAEMRHAAELAGVTGPSGEVDLKAWIKAATEEQGLSYELYVRDSVWPSAALKKLTGGRVQVTPQDLAKGFEANYGERVRCRAIVLGDLRRAQEVWDKARQNPSPEFFGKLAEEYSIEPSSRSLAGEVPPIRRNGGQPQLEQVAFELADGELSGVIQVGDKFILLRCEGRTEPIGVSRDEVREILTRDIFEKKLRIAMSEEFERIRQGARIDNYLAGTSQAPAAKKAQQQAGRRVDAAVRPAGAVR